MSPGTEPADAVLLEVARAALSIHRVGTPLVENLIKALRAFEADSIDALVMAPADMVGQGQGAVATIRSIIRGLAEAEAIVANYESKTQQNSKRGMP